jgi:hypothetical protein
MNYNTGTQGEPEDKNLPKYPQFSPLNSYKKLVSRADFIALVQVFKSER